MTQRLADELIGVVDDAARVRPDAWSVKEILGHLIDSAVNNHQRFVRAQLTDALTFPGYEQNGWVRLQSYQERPWLELIEFWAQCNDHLSHTIRRIPETALEVTCRIGASEPVTLRFLIQDYLVHLRHHLKQIDERCETSSSIWMER